MEGQEHKRVREHLQSLKGRIQNSRGSFLWACVVALLIAMQFAIIIYLPFVMRQYITWFYTLMEVVAVFAVLALTNDNRSMAYKFAWLCIIVVFPVSGYVMFALWGKVGSRNKLNIKIREKIEEVDSHLIVDQEVAEEFNEKHPVSSRMSKYMQAKNSPITKNNQAKYYETGEDAWEDIFVDLEKAERFVFIEFFIVAEGGLWDKLHDILKSKINQGVEVKFLYDDFGALFRTRRDFAHHLRNEGFQVGVFNPIHRYVNKLFMNFRDHRKIIVIDGKIAYTGGFNVGDEYANLIERFGVWKDAGIRVTGDAVYEMVITFLELWTVCAPGDVIEYDKYRAPETFPETDMYCHVLRDGPALSSYSFIGNTYRHMIQYAGKTVYIMTPYLMPDEAMVASILEASHRGVDVRIITPFVPDKKRIKMMTEYNYGLLLKNGVRIYEYQPGFIHSKVIMNEHCAIVGTINVDYRSFYLHYENGIWVYDEEFLKSVRADFEKTFAESIEITYKEWEKRPISRKIMQHIFHVFDTLA